ncbi:MAG: sigma-70 family RNA polymerase sigma factor [Pirellulaceae bacterium]|nr:sigma-70 family RNA polymerase sigma factor [Pirellulaceae bacterium]
MDLHAEREVAQGLREESGQSWQTLYDAFALRVWNSVARRVSSGSDVADIVQETFLAAARSARNYDPERGSLWCWLSGISRNQTALFFRKRASRHDLAGDLELPGREAEPAELLAAKELAIAVRRVLSLLPLDYETLLVGKYLDELSLEDLAAAENSSASAIGSKLARARQAFRNEFEKQTQPKLSREASL